MSSTQKFKDIKEVNEPSFIGREALIKQLSEVIESVHQGKPQFVLINGERGIGKTRLRREFQDIVKEKYPAFKFMEEVCDEIDESKDFIRAMHILYRLYNEFGVIPEKLYVGDAPLKPDFVEFALSNQKEETLVNVFEDVECNAAKIFESVTYYLFSHAKKAPYCLILEDIDLVDRETAGWFLNLLDNMGKITGIPLLFIGVYRGDQASGENNFQRVLPRFRNKPGFVEIKVESMTARDMIPFVRSMLGLLVIDQQEIMPIYKFTRGNPYYLIDFIKGLVEQKKVVWENGGWNLIVSKDLLTRPSKAVEETLIDNYSKLGKHHQTSLEWMTVSLLPLTTKKITALSGIKPAQLIYIMEELVKDLYIVEEEKKGEKYFTISSSALSEKIEKGIDEKQLYKMHIQLAKFFDKKRESEDVVLKIADHFFEGQDKKKAITYSLEAGTFLKKHERYSLAQKYYYRALGLAREVKKNMVCDILIDIGDTLYRLSDYKNALENFKEALSLGAKKDQEVRAKKGKGLCLYGLRKSREALKEMRTFITAFQNNDPEILLSLAFAECHCMNIKKLQNYLTQVDPILKKEPSKVLDSIYKKNKGWLYYYQGFWSHATTAFQEAEKICNKIQDTQVLMESSVANARLSGYTHGLASAWKMLNPVLSYARDTEDFYLLFYSNFTAGLFAMEEAKFNMSQGFFEKLGDIARKKGASREEGYSYLGLALCGFHDREAIEHVEKTTHKALTIANEFNDSYLAAEAYELLGKIYIRAQKLPQSQKYLDFAKKTYVNLQLKWKANRLISSYARIFNLANHHNKALSILADAEKRATQIGDIYHIADNYFERGFIMGRTKKVAEAIQWFKKSEEILDKLGRISMLREVRANIEKCSKALGTQYNLI